MEKRLSRLEEELERNQPARSLIPTCIFVWPKGDIPVTDEQVEGERQEYEAKYDCRPVVVFIVPVGVKCGPIPERI